MFKSCIILLRVFLVVQVVASLEVVILYGSCNAAVKILQTARSRGVASSTRNVAHFVPSIYKAYIIMLVHWLYRIYLKILLLVPVKVCLMNISLAPEAPPAVSRYICMPWAMPQIVGTGEAVACLSMRFKCNAVIGEVD